MGNPNLSFTQRLDEELKSCSLPNHNPQNATSDELIRDMHRVLTGNGAFNHGLIFKVASSNVNLGMLREDVTDVGIKVDSQVLKCAEIQAARAQHEAMRKGEKMTLSKIGKAIWDNKSLLTLLVLSIVLLLLNGINHLNPAGDVDKKIAQLDAKIAKLMPAVPGLPSTLKVTP